MSTPTETLSRADAAWLHLDQRTNHFVVTTLLELEQPLAMNELRTAVAARLAGEPRLSQRVVEPWLPGTPPHWELDPDFDLDVHLHRVTLPPPAGPRELAELIGDLAGRPIDAQRPLWECHLVESYGGGAAIVSRIHHAVGDGASLLETLLSITDVRMRGRFRPAVAARPQRRRTRPANLPGSVRELAGRALSDPLGAAGGAVRFAGAMARVTAIPPDPPNPLRGRLGLKKRVAWSRPLALASISSFAERAGVTVNDVLTSAIAGGLRRHLGDAVPEDPIHAMVPVDVRHPDRPITAHNQFSLVMVRLPVQSDHPWMRLVRTRLEMNRIKASLEPLAGSVLITGLGLLPTPLEHAVSGFYTGKASLVLTNVPGPRHRLYLAGVPIKSMAFWEPESGGIGVGFSVFSYATDIVVGLIADATLVPKPEKLIAQVEDSVEELLSCQLP